MPAPRTHVFGRLANIAIRTLGFELKLAPPAGAVSLVLRAVNVAGPASRSATRWASRSLPPTSARRRCLWQLLNAGVSRSEEHTSELQSHHDLVCRLLLE